uniref:THAP-type domain-containing protein n=1 Tax=Daphnia galeata TaxID=27404 RepID=A0A8J2RDN0_9CRUS|nr:unnamed protein product [Daphnia galeata]
MKTNELPELKQASLLCEKHFDESDVLKGFTDGTVYHPYGRWRLSISAVPKHFLGIKEASSKVVKRTPLKQLFSVNTQQKKRDGIQAKISSVHSMSNNHQNLPSPLGNGANRHKPLKRTFGIENTPPNKHNKKLKLISPQACSHVSKSNIPFQSVDSPTIQHPETEIIGDSEVMETGEPVNLPIETEATVEEETVSCEITTPFQSVDSTNLQHSQSRLIGDSELMETGEHFSLPIETEATVEEETVSCEITATSQSVASPPRQVFESQIIGGRDLMETGEHFNLQIETEGTVEEETVSCETTTTSQSVASTPIQHPEKEKIGGSELLENGENFNLPIETETTVEEDTASCETTTPFQSVASPPRQEPESQLNGDNDLKETGEPFNLPIESETTVQGDTPSCEITTELQSVASPPQQDPETEVIGGSELLENGEHFNFPIETETTVEEDTASCETTTPFQSVASPPHQEPESQLNGDNDLKETREPFNLPIETDNTTVEEDTASCETTTPFQSVASQPHPEPESQLNGDNDLKETGEPFNLPIDTETTVQGDTPSCETTTELQSVASPPQQDPETEIIADLKETGQPSAVTNCYEEVMSDNKIQNQKSLQ